MIQEIINQQYNRMKKFLRSHPGFIREQMQDYLNLYSFIAPEPRNPYKKRPVKDAMDKRAWYILIKAGREGT